MFDLYDPRRSRVYLTEQRYYTHIRRRHPEMDRVEYIEETVTDPHIITRDASDELVEIYYRQAAHPDYPKEWVRVVVRQSAVVTAFVKNYPKPTEEVLWTSPHFLARRPPSG